MVNGFECHSKKGKGLVVFPTSKTHPKKWWPSVLPPRSIEGAESCSPQRKSASSLLGPYPPRNFVPLKIGGWKMKVPWNGCVSLFSNGYLGGGYLGGGYLCSPLFGEGFQFDSYFSNGLKPPTSYVSSLDGICSTFFSLSTGCRMQDALFFFEKQATMSLANVAAATSHWHQLRGYGWIWPSLVTHEVPEISFDSLEFLFRTF